MQVFLSLNFLFFDEWLQLVVLWEPTRNYNSKSTLLENKAV